MEEFDWMNNKPVYFFSVGFWVGFVWLGMEGRKEALSFSRVIIYTNDAILFTPDIHYHMCHEV
jgi:hypothetical protein